MGPKKHSPMDIEIHHDAESVQIPEFPTIDSNKQTPTKEKGNAQAQPQIQTQVSESVPPQAKDQTQGQSQVEIKTYAKYAKRSTSSENGEQKVPPLHSCPSLLSPLCLPSPVARHSFFPSVSSAMGVMQDIA